MKLKQIAFSVFFILFSVSCLAANDPIDLRYGTINAPTAIGSNQDLVISGRIVNSSASGPIVVLNDLLTVNLASKYYHKPSLEAFFATDPSGIDLVYAENPFALSESFDDNNGPIISDRGDDDEIVVDIDNDNILDDDSDDVQPEQEPLITTYESFRIGLFIDNIMAGTLDSNLAAVQNTPAGTDNFSFTLPAGLLVGDHLIRVRLDYANAIPETSEINNDFIYTLSIVEPNQVYAFDRYVREEPILVSFWVPKAHSAEVDQASIVFETTSPLDSDYNLDPARLTRITTLSPTHDLVIFKFNQPQNLLGAATTYNISVDFGNIDSSLIFTPQTNIVVVDKTIPNIYFELKDLAEAYVPAQRFQKRFYGERFDLLANLFWSQIEYEAENT